MPGTGMKHVVARLPEDKALLGVVVGHDRGAWWFFGQSYQPMDVLYCLESFLQTAPWQQMPRPFFTLERNLMGIALFSTFFVQIR